MSDNNGLRLSETTLNRLPDTVALPRYDRSKVGQAIVHIGLGGFHRSHQALYLDDLFHHKGPSRWGVCGVGLLPQDRTMAEALLPQDMLYTLIERDEHTETARVIGVHRDYLHAPGDPAAVLSRMTDPDTRIVSLCNGRPELEAVGVQMTADVEPYELMKIRMLNGSHQALCHFGVLVGHTTADEAMQDPQIHALCSQYMDAVRPLIHQPPGMDLEDYQRTLLTRFGNPAVKDQLARIAFDASSRIPGFVLPSVRDALAQGRPVALFALVVAGWLRYLGGQDDTGRTITPQDPQKDLLLSRVTPGSKDPLPFLELKEVFGSDLPQSEAFVAEVRRALESLYDRGTRATLTDYLGV